MALDLARRNRRPRLRPPGAWRTLAYAVALVGGITVVGHVVRAFSGPWLTAGIVLFTGAGVVEHRRTGSLGAA